MFKEQGQKNENVDSNNNSNFSETPQNSSSKSLSMLRVLVYILLFVMRSIKEKIVRLQGEKDDLKEKMSKENREIKKENKRLKRNNSILKNKVTIEQKTMFRHDKLLTSDEDAIYYTGFKSLKLFYAFHDLIHKHVKRRWYGSKNASKARTMFRVGKGRKLDSKNEFLLVCMRLRLGLLLKF